MVNRTRKRMTLLGPILSNGMSESFSEEFKLCDCGTTHNSSGESDCSLSMGLTGVEQGV